MENSQTQFYRAIVDSCSTSKHHPQYQVWLDYALSTNERGKGVVNSIQKSLPLLKGKRHLDIGCGHGGTCISFAQVGALSTGIDINYGLLKLAVANLSDHYDLKVEFKHMDVMDWKSIELLGKFDIITCDNVIEHVEVPERLIAHLHKLINPKGIVYLTIPNAFSIGQIKKDCHYGQFGISLLDPLDGAWFVKRAMHQNTYDVSSYYPFGYYEDQFRKYGFRSTLLNSYASSEEKLDQIWAEVNSILLAEATLHQNEKIPARIIEKINRFLKQYEKRLETDITIYQWIEDERERKLFADRIIRDYDTELWYVVLTPARFNGYRPFTVYVHTVRNMLSMWKKKHFSIKKSDN